MDKVTTEGLDDVVDVLRRRGIEAGEREAEARVERARAEAAERIAAAQAEAERVVTEARATAEGLAQQLERDLRQALDAGVTAFQRAVERAVLVPAVRDAVAGALAEPERLGAVLTEAARGFASAPRGAADLELLLGPETAQSLRTMLLGRAMAVARGGVRIRLHDDIEGGFALEADGVRLDFSEAAWGEVLVRYLTPHFRQSLWRREGER